MHCVRCHGELTIMPGGYRCTHCAAEYRTYGAHRQGFEDRIEPMLQHYMRYRAEYPHGRGVEALRHDNLVRFLAYTDAIAHYGAGEAPKHFNAMVDGYAEIVAGLIKNSTGNRQDSAAQLVDARKAG